MRFKCGLNASFGRRKFHFGRAGASKNHHPRLIDLTNLRNRSTNLSHEPKITRFLAEISGWVWWIGGYSFIEIVGGVFLRLWRLFGSNGKGDSNRSIRALSVVPKSAINEPIGLTVG